MSPTVGIARPGGQSAYIVMIDAAPASPFSNSAIWPLPGVPTPPATNIPLFADPTYSAMRNVTPGKPGEPHPGGRPP